MAQALPLLPIALSAAGGLAQAGGTIAAGNAQASQLNREAGQLEQMAGQDRASSQRAAIEARRQARLLASRAQAVGAATGGATDPTVINAMARLEAEGAYRGAIALFEGEEQARNREMQAAARRQEARNVKRASKVSALSSVLNTGSTLFSRFGGGMAGRSASAPAPGIEWVGAGLDRPLNYGLRG